MGGARNSRSNQVNGGNAGRYSTQHNIYIEFLKNS